jgi:hypothetical protein
MRDAASEYHALFEKFLNGSMTVEEFRDTYLAQFKNEERLGEPLFEILDQVFGDVDLFTTDRELCAEKPELYLDEAALRERVRIAAICLSASSPPKARLR